MEKQNKLIECERFLLTTNFDWLISKNWYKNSSIGKNTLCKMRKKSTARNIGLDILNRKITNHSFYASAVSELTKRKVQEEKQVSHQQAPLDHIK